MKRDELKQLIRGVIVAAPTPFDDDFEIDYGRVSGLTEWWVESGLVQGKAALKVCSVMGEVPQMREDEWPGVIKAAVDAAKGRLPVMGGIHTKDTRRTIEDAKRAQDLGAIGLQISPPVFNDPTQDDMLRYFGAVSDAIDIGVMIYNTPWMPRGGIMPETFHKMADFEHVVAIKWNTGGQFPYEEMQSLAPIFNICDNSGQPARCFRLGGKGFLDEQATAYPPHELRLLELLESGSYDEAEALWKSVSGPIRDFFTKVFDRSGGQARVKKGVMAVMGHPVGSMRPPSEPLSDEEMAELRELLVSFGWPVPERV